MFNKSYDWACTLLWTGICLTLLILGWSVLYAPYWWSLTIVAVLLALFIITGYIQYTKVLSLKRKFIIVQETFTTAMLVYFAFYYFAGKNQMPADNVLKGARKKIDDVYEASRYHLTMPLVVTALKTFSEIKNIKSAVKSEVKNFASTDGFSVDNAQIIAKELTNLFQKIKQLVGIISEGMPSKKDFDTVMDENIDEMIEKGETAQSSVRQKGKAIAKTVKSGVKSNARTAKRATGKTTVSIRKSIKGK
ncbi:MAG: hypothetical protein IKL32_05190 [Alphaproteobacteria bacterium]|nr:hypothetical protein [Alphaproteobacteria bacterium]